MIIYLSVTEVDSNIISSTRPVAVSTAVAVRMILSGDKHGDLRFMLFIWRDMFVDGDVHHWGIKRTYRTALNYNVTREEEVGDGRRC